MVVSEGPINLDVGKIESFGLHSLLKACYQCSSCTSVCPLRRVSKFNPRKIIHNYLIDKPLDEDDLTICLTCGLCLEVCPQQVDFPEFIRLSRAQMVISDDKYAHHNILQLRCHYLML